MWYKNIAGRLFRLVKKHACDGRTDRQTDGGTDGRTDGKNYDSQDRASIVASRGKNSPKIHHLGTIAQICRAESSQLRHVSTIRKKSIKHQYLLCTCPHNTVNFGRLTAEICWQVWGIPANFNRFRVFAALMHGTLVAGVNQAMQR